MGMVSKEILIQYADLQQEIEYLRKKIDSLQNEQAEMEKKKKNSSVMASSKDFPYTTHNVKTEGYIGLTTISAKNLSSTINLEISKLEKRYEDLLEATNNVLDFIETIDDSRVRMIVTYRFIEGYSWGKVAEAMGGGNTDDSVRKCFERFFEKN